MEVGLSIVEEDKVGPLACLLGLLAFHALLDLAGGDAVALGDTLDTEREGSIDEEHAIDFCLEVAFVEDGTLDGNDVGIAMIVQPLMEVEAHGRVDDAVHLFVVRFRGKHVLGKPYFVEFALLVVHLSIECGELADDLEVGEGDDAGVYVAVIYWYDDGNLHSFRFPAFIDLVI